jgi:hypothetical protein
MGNKKSRLSNEKAAFASLAKLSDVDVSSIALG